MPKLKGGQEPRETMSEKLGLPEPRATVDPEKVRKARRRAISAKLGDNDSGKAWLE
jgi:hypothetical protein